MNPLRIAITGMHRGENPQPGASIVTAIRQRWPDVFIVGLVYTAYESGIYAYDGPDVCHVMPSPAVGLSAYLARLQEIRAIDSFDLLIPTLEVEVALLAGSTAKLADMGIHTTLPSVETLARCDKSSLTALAQACEIPAPRTAVVGDVTQAVLEAETIGYPILIKGRYDDATLVSSSSGIRVVAASILADWGPPLVVQEPLAGNEFSVLGIGDGTGALLGHCTVRKMAIRDKRQVKSEGSVIVRDFRLDEMTRRIIHKTRWLGPFELKFIRAQRDDGYRLLGIHPHFPAWVGFPAQLGVNFPAAWIDWMLDGECPPLAELLPGQYFLRHQVEVTGDIHQWSAVESASLEMHQRDQTLAS
jgi:carbamoyl-phosphate synthase large subunit